MLGNPEGPQKRFIIRYNNNGLKDSTFGNNGFTVFGDLGFNGSISSATEQKNGKILLCGT